MSGHGFRSWRSWSWSSRITGAVVPLLAVALSLAAAPASAQLQTGDLYGQTLDVKGGALPGVTMTLTGIGAPKVEQSDAEGRFHFLELYPGTYHLRAELEGFSPVELSAITVTVGGKPSVVMTLSNAVTETINVTADRPLLDERRLNRGATVATADLDKVPTARDPWSLLSLAPGVVQDRINVGGNESGQQSDFIGPGSTGRDNVFSVDGVILTDMNAVGGSATYFDFGAFEEVQFTVSSADVTVATSGVTINQVTKRGTNDWRASGRYLRTDGNLQSAPFLPDGNKIKDVAEYGADFGGPLLKDNLWFWGAYGRSDINNLAQGGQLDGTNLKDLNAKLNFQAGPQNSGVLHYWTNNKLKNGRDAGPDHAPESTLDQTTPQDIYKVEDSHVFSQNFVVDALWSHDWGKFTLTPKGGLNAHIFHDASDVIHGSNFDFQQVATIDQGHLEGSYFFNLGEANNELKFGGSYRQQDNSSGTVWPGGVVVYDCQDVGCTDPTQPDRAEAKFPRNRSVGIHATYGAGWVQDTLSRGNLTVSAGLRFDRQRLANTPSADPGNPVAQGLLPPISFPGNHAGDFTWNSTVPRISATYALGQERRTLLRGTFSQYAEQLGQIPLATRVNPIGYSYAYLYFNDKNHNLVLDPSEIPTLTYGFVSNINPQNPAALSTPNINDSHLRPDMTNELTFGVDQGFGRDFMIGTTLTYRRISDIPETRLLIVDETGATRFANINDWVPATTDPINVALPNGRQVNVPYYVLRPGLSSTGGTFYMNGDRTQRYLGATLTMTKRLSNQWEMRGHVTYADWRWHIGPNYRFFHDPSDLISDELGYSDRNDQFFEQSTGNKSNVLTGAKWSFNLFGLYQVAPSRPWGFDAGLGVTGRQGYPTAPFVERSGPAGTRDIQLTSAFDQLRNPDIFLLDGHLSKEFRVGDVATIVSLDGFNLLNNHYTLQVERNAEANSAYQILETLSPRVFRIGATFRFR